MSQDDDSEHVAAREGQGTRGEDKALAARCAGPDDRLRGVRPRPGRGAGQDQPRDGRRGPRVL